MTTRAAARQRQRRVNARWRAAALPASYTTCWDTTRPHANGASAAWAFRVRPERTSR